MNEAEAAMQSVAVTATAKSSSSPTAKGLKKAATSVLAPSAPRQPYMKVMRSMSFMAWLTDAEALRILLDASDSLEVSDSYVQQRFSGLDHYSAGHLESGASSMGSFELNVKKVSSKHFVMGVEVRIEPIAMPGASLDGLIPRIQASVEGFWAHYRLSGPGGVLIEIVPMVSRSSDGADLTMRVYPDSHSDFMFEGVGGGDCNVYETFSFLPMAPPFEEKKGRFPHEFGHMMGLPHDVELGTVMYTNLGSASSGKDMNVYWRQGRANAKPRPEHFKLVRVWCEYILKKYFKVTTKLRVEPRLRPTGGIP